MKASIIRVVAFAALITGQSAVADYEALLNRYIDVAQTDVLYQEWAKFATRDFTYFGNRKLGPGEQAYLKEQYTPEVVREFLVETFLKRNSLKAEDLENEIRFLESDIGKLYMNFVATCRCFSIELMPEGRQAAVILKEKAERGIISAEAAERLNVFLLSKEHNRFYFDHRSALLGSGGKRAQRIKKALKKIRRSQ